MFLLGATLALGFMVAAFFISNAIRTIRIENGIKVKGYAEVSVKADLAKWKVQINARDTDIKMAYRKIENDFKIALDKLKSLGISDKEILIGSASINEEKMIDEKGNKTNKIEYYKIIHEISITTTNVDQVLASQNGLSSLIKDGINIDIGNAAFTYTKLEDVKLDLLGQASHNAFERAQIMVAKTNGKIGPVRSASQGVFQIVPRNSTDVSDYGSYDVTTIEKTVKAVITMDFEIIK